MKNLAELQERLFQLASEIERLSEEIEELKPRQEAERNYTLLEQLADKSPLQNKKLKEASARDRELYLRLLCMGAGLVGGISDDQLIYLCRLMRGCGQNIPLPELEKWAYQADKFDWRQAAIDLKGLYLPLLADLVMLVNLTEPANGDALDFVSEMAILLGCPEEDLTVIAQLVSCVLTDDQTKFDQVKIKKPYPELEYLLPKTWVFEPVLCGTCPVSTSVETACFSPNLNGHAVVELECSAGEFVVKGSPLVTFTSDMILSETEKSRIALHSDICTVNRSGFFNSVRWLPLRPLAAYPAVITAACSGYVYFTMEPIKDNQSEKHKILNVHVQSPFDNRPLPQKPTPSKLYLTKL